MSHSIIPARLLTENLETVQELSITHGFLDLACGSGRNGLQLARCNLPVTFADRDAEALARVQSQLDDQGLKGVCWQVDLEQAPASVLAGRSFDGVLVFNYLHRPLFPALKKAVRPGGILFYETFTNAQRQFGRPANPDFLLQPDELSDYFNDWEVLHNYEGELTDPQRAVAQLIARKPERDSK